MKLRMRRMEVRSAAADIAMMVFVLISRWSMVVDVLALEEEDGLRTWFLFLGGRALRPCP